MWEMMFEGGESLYDLVLSITCAKLLQERNDILSTSLGCPSKNPVRDIQKKIEYNTRLSKVHKKH
jgi:hypothetical protein